MSDDVGKGPCRLPAPKTCVRERLFVLKAAEGDKWFASNPTEL